jgi:uncharacterized protein (TIGR03083 family)
VANNAMTNSEPTRPDVVRPPTLDDAAAVLERAIPRVTALVRDVPYGAQRVPHLEWTIAETAAHLWSGVTICAGLLQGGADPCPDIDGRAETNAAIIADIQERDPTALAALIERDAPAMAAAFRAYGAKPITYLFGMPASATTALAGIATEFVIHGWDIAQTLAVPWPITPADAIVIIRGTCDVWPMFVAPEAANFQGTYEVSLRGGPVITMSFSDGCLTFAEGKAARPDCRISANPSSFLLSAYGRLGRWSPTFKGQILAYGRKPWLALRFPSLFRQP